MNTTMKLLVMTLALAGAAPAGADTIAEQIRNQGHAAIESVGAEIKQNVLGTPTPAPRVTVEEAIRLQAERAVRNVGLAITLRFHGRHGPTIAAAL